MLMYISESQSDIYVASVRGGVISSSPGEVQRVGGGCAVTSGSTAHRIRQHEVMFTFPTQYRSSHQNAVCADYTEDINTRSATPGHLRSRSCRGHA